MFAEFIELFNRFFISESKLDDTFPNKQFHIIGDLNMNIANVHLKTLLQLFNLNALINSPTCYQSHIPTCIDHILTNQKSLFKFSKTFETGLSDHHKLISTTMKSGSFKGPPQKRSTATDVIKTLTLQILATL